jgi:hypothetical protein
VSDTCVRERVLNFEGDKVANGVFIMCVIFVKPKNVAFPEEQIMQNCWDNNPDMGGFMYTYEGKVIIRKGFETFADFKSALSKARKLTGDNVPYVCHFRISTQGYDTSCCQPFPLSSKMGNMKKLRNACNVGVAHNGVLSLTSDGSRDYSDTMKFIQDYLVNIIQSKDWYKNDRTKTLIENLIKGSRFAFLDANGHIETLGQGWVTDKGITYSNTSYSRKKVTFDWGRTSHSIYDDAWYDDGYYWNKTWDATAHKWVTPTAKTAKTPQLPKEEKSDPYSIFYSPKSKTYEFPKYNCPFDVDDDDSYCMNCSKFGTCMWTANTANKASGFVEL